MSHAVGVFAEPVAATQGAMFGGGGGGSSLGFADIAAKNTNASSFAFSKKSGKKIGAYVP